MILQQYVDGRICFRITNGSDKVVYFDSGAFEHFIAEVASVRNRIARNWVGDGDSRSSDHTYDGADIIEEYMLVIGANGIRDSESRGAIVSVYRSQDDRGRSMDVTVFTVDAECCHVFKVMGKRLELGLGLDDLVWEREVHKRQPGSNVR